MREDDILPYEIASKNDKNPFSTENGFFSFIVYEVNTS